MGLGTGGGGNNLFFGCVFVPPQQVFLNGSAKQHVLLQNHTNPFPQVIHGVIFHVYPVHQNRPFIHVVKPRNHRNQGGFPATGGTDNTHGGACFYGKINMIQHRFFAVFIITEGNVTEFNFPFGNGLRMLCGIPISHVNFFIQNLFNPLGGSHSPSRGHKKHGNHHNGEQNLGNIG